MTRRYFSKLVRNLEISKKKLNPNFIEKANPNVVEREKKKLENFQGQYDNFIQTTKNTLKNHFGSEEKVSWQIEYLREAKHAEELIIDPIFYQDNVSAIFNPVKEEEIIELYFRTFYDNQQFTEIRAIL